MYKMVWSFIALCGLSLHVAANEIELSISDEIIDLRFAVSYEQDFSGTFALLHADHNDVKTRSEERRVGKEGRSRGSPYH